MSKGVKLTDQRRVIAKIMSESTDHPDVDELYNRASKIDPKISIATVDLRQIFINTLDTEGIFTHIK